MLVPCVGVPRKLLPPFTRGFPFSRRIEKRNNPPNRPLDRYWLRSRRVAASRRSVRSDTAEERWFHLPRMLFFSLPTPPSDLSVALIYMSVLRNAYNSQIIDCLDKISIFLSISIFDDCLNFHSNIRIHSDKIWRELNRTK